MHIALDAAESPNERDGQRRLARMMEHAIPAFALVVCSACSSGSSGSAGTGIYTDWKFVNAIGAVRAGLTVRQDGSYERTSLAETATTAADVQVEDGTFVVDGETLKLTPTQSSCSGADPAYSLAYALQDGGLAIGANKQVYVPGDAKAAYAEITIGCFAASGDFTAAPVAAVSLERI